MKTLAALACLLFACPALNAQYRPPYGDLGAQYGVVFYGAAPIDWFGQNLFLFWSLPRDAHQERLPVITLDSNPFALIAPAVGVEMVGWAAYDPRPCAVGSRAVLSAPANDYHVQVLGPQGRPPAFTSSSLIGPDGFAYGFYDLPYPLLEPWYLEPSDYTFSEYGVSYCRQSAPWGSCTSECEDGLGPSMGFILGRLVLL